RGGLVRFLVWIISTALKPRAPTGCRKFVPAAAVTGAAAPASLYRASCPCRPGGRPEGYADHQCRLGRRRGKYHARPRSRARTASAIGGRTSIHTPAIIHGAEPASSSSSFR